MDTQDCTDGYKAYAVLVFHGVVLSTPEIPDDDTSTADVITQTYSRLVNVGLMQVWCGERGSGRMVGEVAVPRDAGNSNLGIPGTYTTAAADSAAPPALSALTVSAGTVTPVFAGGTLAYTVPDVPYGNNRITVTATADTDATVSYEDGAGNTLSDVDSTTTGDQFDLTVGENTIKVKLTRGSASQTYTLTLTRAAPAVSVSAAAATAGEGDSLTFTVSRTPAAGDALTLTVNVAESEDLVPAAEEGDRTVTIAADATAATLTVNTGADDSDWEEHSTVSVTAPPNAGYTLSAASASTQVKDDDFPAATAALTVSPTTVNEPGTATVTVTVTTQRDEMPHGPGGTLTVASSDITASASSDYDAFNQTYALDAAGFSAVTIGGSQRWWRVYSGTVTVKDDTTQESAETFHLVLTNSGAPKVTLLQSTVPVTIPANDAPAASSDASLSGLSLSGVTLTPTFSGGTTTGYTASVANSVSATTVTATLNHAAATVEITPVDADASAAGHQVNLDVGSNTISVKVTAADGVTTRTYTVTVTRAAPGAAPSDITLSATVLVTGTVYEPQGGVIVAVRVRTDSYEKPQAPLTLTVRSFPDTAHEGTDYLPFTETVTFSPADFFGYYDSGFFEAIKHAARFRIVDDNTPESDERFIISVSTAASSASTAAAQGAIVTIDDGDEPLAPTSSRQPRVASAIYDADEDAVVLEWDAGSDTGGLTGYRIERSAPGGTTELTHADLRGGDRPAVGPGVSTWNDTTVPASSLVLYRVWAVFSDGSEVASAAFPATMDRGIARARVTIESSNIRTDVSWTDAAYPLGDGSLHYGVCPEGYKVYFTIPGSGSVAGPIQGDTDPAERTLATSQSSSAGLFTAGDEVPFRVRCGGDSATTGLLIGEDTATVQ